MKTHSVRRAIRLIPLLLAAGSCALLLVYHLLFGKPEWWLIVFEGAGWTLYPPLGMSPQAIPGVEPYASFLQGAQLCALAAVATGLWVWSRYRQQTGRGLWWAGLLLLPVGVHWAGHAYVNRLKCQAEQQQLREDSMTRVTPAHS